MPAITVNSQEYGNPEYYLIDSLEVDNLDSSTQTLLDTTLKSYHATNDEIEQLELLQNMVTLCWDEKVWPRYNLYIGKRIQKLAARPNAIKNERRYKKLMGNVVSNIGFMADQMGDYTAALDYYHMALDLHRDVDNYKDMSSTLNNIAVIHSLMGESDKSMEYQEKSIEYKKIVDDSAGLSVSYINIGTTLENQNKNEEALRYYKNALKISKQHDNERNMAKSLDKVGDVLFKQGKVDEAIAHYKKAISYWKSVGSDIGLSNSENNLAIALLSVNEHDKARRFAQHSYKLSKELGYPVDIQNSSRTMSRIHRVTGDYKTSLEFYDEYMSMREIIQNDETNKEIYHKTMQYEYERNALEDSLEYVKREEVNRLKIETQRTENYALYGGLFLCLIILVVGIRSFIQKKKDNALIRTQKIEVEQQKHEIEEQHLLLEAHMKEISDSISYAERIQAAILPSRDKLNEQLVDGFVFFKPKDVVSGDFYWLEKSGDNILFAAADCTGHGVPGAMVSVVCNNALKRSVREYGLTDPANIMEKCREIVIETLSDNQMSVKDGMDISLCCLNKKEQTLKWAGANNPLYIIRKGSSEIEILKPDKQPIGWYNVERPFHTREINYQKGDLIYVFTDGYADQFGGEKGKKMKYKFFQEQLIKGANQSMDEQRELLENFFNEWMGDFDQIDDVCIIGVRL